MNINQSVDSNNLELTPKVNPQVNGRDLGDSAVSFADEFSALLKEEGTLNPLSLDDLGFLSDIETLFSYDTVKMDKNDVDFFLNLVNDKAIVNLPSLQDFSPDVKEVTKSTQVSKTLLSALENSYKNKTSFRIDFDNQIAVVLKVDKEGKVSAQFFPGDKVAEEYLRNNIPYLKQRFDDQNLSYNELSYKQQKNNQNKDDNDNKENK